MPQRGEQHSEMTAPDLRPPDEATFGAAPAPRDAPPPVTADVEARTLLRPRKVLTQLLGFAVGIALLVWCVRGAFRAGEAGAAGPSAWELIRSAEPWLIAGLVGCSVVSLIVNGAIFWVTLRPLQRLPFGELQILNFAATLLNYAPIRLGLISRIIHHVRVDHLPLLRIGGWFAAIAYTTLLCLGAAVAATLLRPQFDWVWFALLTGQLLLGGLITQALMSQPVIVRYGRGMDAMLRRSLALWGAIALRMADLAAFAGRIACAVLILQLSFDASDVLLLSFTALALNLNPLGRFGFREAGVAFVAGMLASGELSPEEVDARMKQLALLESAGEALVAVPLGAMGLWWLRRTWTARRGQAS